MSTTTSTRKGTTSNPFRPRSSAHEIRRQFSNSLVIGLSVLFALFAVAVLVYLILYVMLQGIPYLNMNFFTKLPTANGEPGGGMGEAVQGTLIMIGLASIFGIVLGLFTAIYLSEFGQGPLASGIRFLVDLLNGVPTIIFGLFAWVLIVVPQQTFSGLAGAMALAIIMIPIVARTAEDVLRLVPRELREASLALGATEARTIVKVVVPAALRGIITGIVLAMARIAGETAPLLMTAFGTTFWNTDITQPMDAMTLRIFNFTLSPYQAQINLAYTGSFVLIVIILIASFAVRWVTGGFKRKF
ncbi:MAG TPA: phosphate ABC transporter permease PstA [Ktedonobacteraceae bacterium]|nr:phosphate ABC transporter permease PstA [Ktedonobacteraceae bacterium]